MFCANCGKQLDDQTAFCPFCGTPTGVKPAAEQFTPPEMPDRPAPGPVVSAPAPQPEPPRDADEEPAAPQAHPAAEEKQSAQSQYVMVDAKAAKKAAKEQAEPGSAEQAQQSVIAGLLKKLIPIVCAALVVVLAVIFVLPMVTSGSGQYTYRKPVSIRKDGEGVYHILSSQSGKDATVESDSSLSSKTSMDGSKAILYSKDSICYYADNTPSLVVSDQDVVACDISANGDVVMFLVREDDAADVYLYNKGKTEKIGGVGANNDSNAVTIIAKYFAAPRHSEEVCVMMIQSLEKLCRELVASNYETESEDAKIQGKALELCRAIYENSTSRTKKSINLIQHWF